MTINSINLSGNLTRDAELRRTQSDMAVLGFGLAFNERRRKPDSEEWEEIPNFIDCTLFGNRAEALSEYLVKGTKVSINGRLRWSQWEMEDGSKRSKHEVIVDELEFMTPRKTEE
ncbi:MAG: single-stranded DNA-binding protein [Eggerthellaceae bacterium]|nr:single-stranded DNA-binding protein [Eggerthellaceae bacterium]